MRLRDSGSTILFLVIGVVMVSFILIDTQLSSEREQREPEQAEENREETDNGSAQQPEAEDPDKNNHNNDSAEISEPEKSGTPYEITVYTMGNEQWIKVSDLVEVTGGTYEWDQVNRVLQMTIFQIPFEWTENVPVLERNGTFLPFEWQSRFYENEGEIYIPTTFFEQGLEGVRVETNQESQSSLTFYVDQQAEEVFADYSQNPLTLEDLTTDHLIDYLSFLSNPIPGATISTRDSHLPGARRAYRNGYHEGIDWYSGTSGRNIDLNTAVLSVADGVVVRVDHDYVEMTRAEREGYLALSATLPDTPAYILDKLRGRSIWVQYDHGVMLRYVHLSRVEDNLEVGQEVKRGDVLGYVGNSGTSYAIKGEETGGLHLHADVLIYGELFWQYVDDLNEVRSILNDTFQDDEG